MKAVLLLEDGTVFEGESFGVQGEAFGEAVFNTSITGYQEIITDPSYKGQIVAMTYPLIGNYGVNEEDIESSKPWLEGFVVKELTCKEPYSWSDKLGVINYKLTYKVAVLGCGVKFNILRNLSKAGCRVKIVPATTSAEEILKLKPDGLLLSNGPGDPKAV